MILFVSIAALMALLTLAWLTRPLWRRSAHSIDATEDVAPRRSSTMIAALTGFVAIIVLAGYTLVGAPLALDPGARVARDANSITAEQIEAMVAKLDARLKQ